MLHWLTDLGLWPAMLSLEASATLLLTSIFTSAMTAAFGLGGGVVMLAVLVNFLPISVVIPVHGVIQVSSNISRAFLLRFFIDWRISVYFLLGAIVGALIGGQFVVSLSENLLLAVLGVFILYIVWGPKPKQLTANRFTYVLGGAAVTFSTMFIGATGPLAMALIPRKRMQSQQISATHATIMIMQHGLKAIIFGVLGFQFKAWGIFLLLMLITGFIGTLFGKSLLQRLPQALFQKGITVILSLLALKMLFDAGMGWSA